MMHMIKKKGVSFQFKFYFIQSELPATIQKWILLVVMQNIFLSISTLLDSRIGAVLRSSSMFSYLFWPTVPIQLMPHWNLNSGSETRHHYY